MSEENSKENSKENISRPDIASEIKEMLRLDQIERKKARVDKGSSDFEVDRKNTQRMREIIAEVGFPTVSMVGNEGQQNAWLLVQHADEDVEFQKECLDLMRRLSPSDTSERFLRHVAYLEDRIRVNQGQPQLYGTQFHVVNGKHTLRTIEDEDKINDRRASMGMNTLDDQIAMMNRAHPLP